MTTRFMLAILAAVAGICPASAQVGKFDKKLVFTEENCAKALKCYLKQPFGYVDSTGVGWEAPAGQWTNGASIPEFLRARYGNPFDADLIRAAVIHDHYNERKVRTWTDTHWVFYDALLTSKIERHRAIEMYGGLLLGAELWIIVKKGTGCTTGKNCVQQVSAGLLPLSDSQKINEDGDVLLIRNARYDDPAFDGDLAKFKAKLEADPGIDTRKEIEALASSIRPADPILTGPETIVITPADGGVTK